MTRALAVALASLCTCAPSRGAEPSPPTARATVVDAQRRPEAPPAGEAPGAEDEALDGGDAHGSEIVRPANAETGHAASPTAPGGAPQGDLDKDHIREVVRAHVGDARRCYARELAKQPSLAGRVDIRFTIGPTGAVVAAEVVGERFDPAVADCVAAAIRTWVFTAPRGGGHVVVSYPFTFAPA